MAISSESLKQDLDRLTQEQLQQVADFIAFLKFQNKHRLTLNPKEFVILTTEFAEEDRTLAQEGMSDYAVMLHQEDRL